MKVEYDPESWHREVLVSFEICLETLELKHIALELLKEEVIKLNNDLKELNKDKKNNYSHYKYEIIEKTKYFVECIFDIYCSLNEIDKAISYYHKYHPKEVNDEIKEYILLDYLDRLELYDKWILEYEKHIGKIEYRDSLKKQYNEYKNK